MLEILYIFAALRICSSKEDWLRGFSLMTKNLLNFPWILKTKDNFQSVRTNMPVKPHLVLSRPRLACLPSPHTNIKTKCRQNKTRGWCQKRQGQAQGWQHLKQMFEIYMLFDILELSLKKF